MNQNSEDALIVLRHEFDGEPGSFLLHLRVDLYWDKAGFNRVTSAMHTLVCLRDGAEPIPRWIAEGFWFLDSFVREWSTHANFPRQYELTYYNDAYERLHDLAYWLFMGFSPYEGENGFDEL